MNRRQPMKRRQSMYCLAGSVLVDRATLMNLRSQQEQVRGIVASRKRSPTAHSSCTRIAVIVQNGMIHRVRGRHPPTMSVGVITKQSNQYGPSWSNVATPRLLDVKLDPMHPVRCSYGQVYLIGRPPNTVRTR